MFSVNKVLLEICSLLRELIEIVRIESLKAKSAFGFPSFGDIFGFIFPNVARDRLLSSPCRSSDSGRYGLFSDEGCNPRGFGDVG